MRENMSETMSVAVSGSKSERAYAFIRNRIDDGSYSPGFRLVFGQIAKQLGVSAVPVREALRRLEAEGLVTFERNVGAQVAMVDEREYFYTMETLSLVEGAATALSAPFVTSLDFIEARDINAAMTDCLDHFNPHRFTELNFEFHAVIFEHCPNPHILDLVHRGWKRLSVLRDSTFSFVPGRARESVQEHERLLQLIEGGVEPLEIEMAARAHRTGTLDALLSHQANHADPLTDLGRLDDSQA